MEWETKVSTDTNVQPEVFANNYFNSVISIKDIGSNKRSFTADTYVAVNNSRKNTTPATLHINNIQLIVC